VTPNSGGKMMGFGSFHVKGAFKFWSRVDLFRFPRQTVNMDANNPNSSLYAHAIPEQVAFHRTELSVIMSVYGRMVAAGEWRDYGISCLREVAVFSIFRRTAEYPLYRIEKRPKLRMRQGQYAVISMDGQILKRGNDLKVVMRVLEKLLIRAVT
jgi:hypothetical protein